MLDNWKLKKYINAKKKDTSGEKVTEFKKITIENIKNIFYGCSDVNYKKLIVGKEECFLIYIENLVDQKLIDSSILRPLLNGNNKPYKFQDEDVFTKLEKGIISHISTKIEEDFDKLIHQVLNGNVCLISTKNSKISVTFDVIKVPKRAITEPSNENIIKGSKESFIENIKVNMGLVRNRIKTPNLKVKEFKIGSEAPTKVEVIYLDSVVDKKILDELVRRLNSLKMKNLFAVADFEEQLIEKKYSIFPQILYTEKTDKFVANIVEGKIGIIIDGIPVAYIVPALFNMFFQAPEDYSVNYVVSSVLRILRYVCMIITLIFPAFFVAVTTFHQEMIPTELALSIIASKEGEPFPTIIEVAFMLLAFEILIEASTRLPKTIGNTISIVGGLIIGEAAVTAKLVSPVVVVLIAITGIAGFLMPNQDFSNALRVTRFLLLLAASIAGLYGLAIGLIVIFYYLATLESFGIPYMTPFSGTEGRNILSDTIIRPTIRSIESKTNKN